MLEVTLDKDLYLARFSELEKALDGRAPGWLRDLRRTAMARFSDLGFPTTREEEWRFTSVAPIARTRFLPAGPAPVSPEEVRKLTFPDRGMVRLVFVGGKFAPQLSSAEELPRGVFAGSLAEALEVAPAGVEPFLARHARYENHAFAALNTALMEDGAYVRVEDRVRVERPIHLVYVSAGPAEPTMSHPRTLVVAGAGSELSFVESYVGTGAYLTNAVTEIVAGENAIVHHCRYQKESTTAFHTGTLEAHLAADANVTSVSISLGGELVRNDLGAVLDGPGAHAALDGLYLLTGAQHVDNHTSIDHAKPHCTSHELYKGVLGGKSRAVFNGRILVRKDAQKTDSRQTNMNLLLSDEALVNTNPQLEIYADDVKCTHGATIGQLDDNALFYLRARGIPHKAARALLSWAFANDIVERIHVPDLKTYLECDLITRLPEGGAR